MPKIYPTCGLPREICACEDIARGRENVRVFTERRSYGKTVTVIGGLDNETRNIEGLASELKKSFGCGGTVKNGHIELQGDHREEVERTLIDRGLSRRDVEVR